MNAGTGLRWLARDKPNLEKAAHALKNIVGNGDRASQVVQTLRAMFNKEVSNRTLVDINDAIRAVLTLLRIELEEHEVVTKAALKEALPRVMADRVQLQQVIFNLVTNAIEAMSSIRTDARILRLRSEATESGECYRCYRGLRPRNRTGNNEAHLRAVLHEQKQRNGNGVVDLPIYY